MQTNNWTLTRVVYKRKKNLIVFWRIVVSYTVALSVYTVWLLNG